MELCSRCGEEIGETGEYDSEVYDYIDRLCSVCLYDLQCEDNYEEYPTSLTDLNENYISCVEADYEPPYL